MTPYEQGYRRTMKLAGLFPGGVGRMARGARSALDAGGPLGRRMARAGDDVAARGRASQQIGQEWVEENLPQLFDEAVPITKAPELPAWFGAGMGVAPREAWEAAGYR